MVARRRKENLRFVLKAAEGLAVNNPVPVALITGSDIALVLCAASAP